MEQLLIYSLFLMVSSLAILFAVYFFIAFKKKASFQQDIMLQKINMETISKQANDVILVADLVYGTIYSANDQASELLLYSNEELLEKTIHELHPESLLALSSKTMARAWDEKGIVYQDLPFVDKNGELIEVECSTKILIYNDKPAILIYARDVRERLALEREVKKKSKNITDSINYAERIQQVILGKTESLTEISPESFVLFKPHSVVSGDFYWFAKIDNRLIIAAADCTGHGVPGAFLTILGHNFLEDIVRRENTYLPNKILSKLHQKMSSRLGDSTTGAPLNDGIDISVLSFDFTTKQGYFSGAKNPLLIVKNGIATRIKGSNNCIGGCTNDKHYELHALDLNEPANYYLYSDGFQDQFGGTLDKKYMAKRFRAFLHSIHTKEMDEQLDDLSKEFEAWKGSSQQTDDVLVIGVRA